MAGRTPIIAGWGGEGRGEMHPTVVRLFKHVGYIRLSATVSILSLIAFYFLWLSSADGVTMSIKNLINISS